MYARLNRKREWEEITRAAQDVWVDLTDPAQNDTMPSGGARAWGWADKDEGARLCERNTKQRKLESWLVGNVWGAPDDDG